MGKPVTSAERPGERVDLLVRNAHIITMDDAGTVIPDGAISIKDGAIVRVGSDSDVTTGVVAQRVIDAGGAPVHPGLVECHLHASFQPFRGALPDQLPETDGLRHLRKCVLQRRHRRGGISSPSPLASMEMIRNGTTCFLEAGTVLSPSVAARAAEHVGIRAVLGDAFIWDQPQGFAQGIAAPGRSCGTQAQQGAPAVEARTPDRVTEALAQLGGQLIRNSRPGGAGHRACRMLGLRNRQRRTDDGGQSVAPTRPAWCSIFTSPTARPTRRPTAAGSARIRWCTWPRSVSWTPMSRFAHVNHLTDAECDVLVQCGATIAWAPAASMMWGHGGTITRTARRVVAARREHRARLRFAQLVQRLRPVPAGQSRCAHRARESHRDRTYLIAEDGLAMATRGGARAVGQQDRIGSIEPGKRADIVIHTLRRPELNPLTEHVRNLIYSSRIQVGAHRDHRRAGGTGERPIRLGRRAGTPAGTEPPVAHTVGQDG